MTVMGQLVRIEPAKVYRFLSEGAALRTLESERFKVGLPHEFNDPFDCVVGFDETYAAQPYELMVSKLNYASAIMENLGVICFTEDPRDPLLWAHYADKHQGIALEFTTPFLGPISNVIYSEKRPTINPMLVQSTMSDQALQMEVQKLMLRYKAKNWEYEKEWRKLVNLTAPECEASGGFFRIKIPEKALTRIIIGARCDVSRNYIRRAIGGTSYKEATIVKAAISDSAFSVEMDLGDNFPVDDDEG